ncbi:MAG: lipopolysaccharide biosynthesis protein [Giesbergeria sp.]
MVRKRPQRHLRPQRHYLYDGYGCGTSLAAQPRGFVTLHAETQRRSILMHMIRQLKARFSKGGFVRSVATLTLGTVFAQILSLAAMPVLTRLYTPADFGFLAVFTAISSLVAIAITLRYETAVLPAKTNEESATVALLCLVCIFTLGILMLVVSMLLPASALRLLSLGGQLGPWLPVAVLTGVSTAILTTTQSWLNRHKRYKQMAGQRVAQSATIVGLGLLFGTLLKHDQGLLLAQVLASIMTAGIALWLARSMTKQWRSSDVKSVAQIHANAPKYLLLTALLDTFTFQLPVILIANWFGQDMAGQFSMAWRVLTLPMGLVGAAIGQVFLQRFAQMQREPQVAKYLLKKTWRILFFLGFFPMASIFFFGEYLFQWALGDSWGEAGRIASVLAPMLLAMLISAPTSGTYIVLGLQRYNLIFGVVTFIYRPLCLLLGYLSGNFMIALQFWVGIDIVVIFLYQIVALRGIDKNVRLYAN